MSDLEELYRKGAFDQTGTNIAILEKSENQRSDVMLRRQQSSKSPRAMLTHTHTKSSTKTPTVLSNAVLQTFCIRDMYPRLTMASPNDAATTGRLFLRCTEHCPGFAMSYLGLLRELEGSRRGYCQ